MDSNLLKQLIAQHKRVVIPEFGAFLKKETADGEQLVFSPFLRKDDGVVTEAIIREYDVEAEDAKNMAAEFVTHLKHSLSSTGRFYIDGVGTLLTDLNGAIILKEGEEVKPEPVQKPLPQPEDSGIKAQSIQVQEEPAEARQPTAIPPQPPRPQPVAPPVPPVQNRPQSIPHSFPGQRPPVPPGQQPGQPGMAPRPGMRPPVPPVPPPPGARPAPSTPFGQSMHPHEGQVPPKGPQPPEPNRQMGMGGPGQSGFPPAGGGKPAGPGPQKPGGPGAPGRPPQRPTGQRPKRRGPVKTKTDAWLIVAIVAALIVIGIMIYGFLNTEPTIDMTALPLDAAPADTTVVMEALPE